MFELEDGIALMLCGADGTVEQGMIKLQEHYPISC